MLYEYSKIVNTPRLEKEIRESDIVIALDYITTRGEELKIYFNDNLSPTDEGILDALVAAHVNEPLIENTVARVQPTVVYNEHGLVPKGMKKIRFQANQYCAEITLSNRVGNEFDYSSTLVPEVGSYVVQNDCMLRFFIESVDTVNGKLTLGSPDGMDLDELVLTDPILLSNAFTSDCTIEFETAPILYLWGLTFQSRSFGDDDILYLKVMMPTEGGLVLVKPYERTWASNVHKVGYIETPDKAPGEIPAGLVMRISYYTFKTDATIIHANYDYVLTVKS